MALPANHLSFLFLLVLIFSTQTQARESKFFSKFNHYQQLNTTINATTTTTGNGNTMNSTTANTSTTTTTTPSSESLKETELPQEQVPSGKQVEEQNSHGYGLYGSNQNPPTTAKTSQEYTYANTPNKASTEEYTGGGYEEEATTGYENDNKNNYGYKPKQFGMSDTRFMDNANVYNNNNNNNGYNNNQYETSFAENGSNGAKTKQLGMSDTSFLDNNDINTNNGFGDKQYSSSYTGVQENDNNGFETKEFRPSDSKFLDNGNINNDNGYDTKQYKTRANKNGDNLSGVKQQGASDTRFMENGKYFYNVNNENSYLNDYQPESRSYDEFSSSQRVDARNNNNHGNNENAYEFNNSMGESQYQDEENQEKFLP